MGKLNWTAWPGIEDFSETMDRLVDELRARGESRSRAEVCLWQPPLDAVETATELILTLDIPGVPLENVGVELRDRELVIFGERRFERDARGAVYHTLERAYGPFARRFELPFPVEAGAIRAELKDGLLTLAVPKRPATGGPRRITIDSD
jgi:HSP20 family protein